MDKELERNQKYQQLSETLQRLYGSAESGAKLYEIFTTFHLKEEHYPIYIEIVGDTILGYYRLSDIPRLLQQRMILSADRYRKSRAIAHDGDRHAQDPWIRCVCRTTEQSRG